MRARSMSNVVALRVPWHREDRPGVASEALASNIAGLLCAAAFARVHEDEASARFLAEYADFLEAHVEKWTVTTAGTLVPGISRHHIRITPEDCGKLIPHGDPDHSVLGIKNCAPGAQTDFPEDWYSE